MSTVLAVPDDVRAKVEAARPILAANAGSLRYVEVTHEANQFYMPAASGCGSADLVKIDHAAADIQFGFSGIARVILWRRVT